MRAGGWLAASRQAVLQISSRDDITLFPTSGNGWQKWARLGCLWGGGANKATTGQVNIASAACLALLEPGTPKAVASRNGQQPVASSLASQRWGPLGLNSFSWAFYLHTSLEWTPKRFSNVSWAANFPCDLFCWGPNPSQRLHAMKASAGHRPRRQS